MTVLNRIGGRIAGFVLPSAEASAVKCGQYCYCYNKHKYEYSCAHGACVWTANTC